MLDLAPSTSTRPQRRLDPRYVLVALVPFVLGGAVRAVGPTSESRLAEPAARAPGAADTERAEKVIPTKVARYARRLIEKYDRDGDRRLQPREWKRLRGDPAAADLDGNGSITQDELTRHIAAYGRSRRIRPPRPAFSATDFPPMLAPASQLDSSEEQRNQASPSGVVAVPGEAEPPTDPPVSEAARRGLKFFVPSARLPKGLPTWFVGRDADGDGQLTLAEFAPKASRTQFDQFARYDADGDGVITAAEYLRGAKPAEKESSP